MPAYSAFAEIYNAWQRLYGLEYAILVAPRVNQRLQAHVGRPRTLIDLACGTGSHAVLQANGGTYVIGIDLSAAMLHQAQIRAAGRPIDFIQADMRTFDTHKPVDAVTCLYASLNHLLDPQDLTETFKRVAAHLRPGGAFVFDLNSEHAFQTLWRTPVTEHGPTFSLHRRFDADGPQTTMHLTIERPDHPPAHDTLIARSYRETQIRAALTGANFTLHDLTHFNPFPTVPGTDLKQLWTATLDTASHPAPGSTTP